MNKLTRSHTGLYTLIKDELKARGISQKEFAKAIGVSQSYLSDILACRRRLSVQTAQSIESVIGISSRVMLDLQVAHQLKDSSNIEDTIVSESVELFREIDQHINIRTLLKAVKVKTQSIKEQLDILRQVFGITDAKQSIESLTEGCFRKSVNTGLDIRMIKTWIILTKAISQYHTPIGSYNSANLPALSKQVSQILHTNNNTIPRLESILSAGGIGLLRVDKVDRASIDGFSFFNNGIPYIAITCRYDRIDNLAFTVMHELGHLYHNHTTPYSSRINIDTRSFEDDVNDEKEVIADQFAGDNLIPAEKWKFCPRVSSNPWAIQAAYTKWAKEQNLNEWIVLGRLSHETGMYKFKSNETRKIAGGKEVCHQIVI